MNICLEVNSDGIDSICTWMSGAFPSHIKDASVC